MNTREELAAVVQAEVLGVAPLSPELLSARTLGLARRVATLEKQIADWQRQMNEVRELYARIDASNQGGPVLTLPEQAA